MYSEYKTWKDPAGLDAVESRKKFAPLWDRTQHPTRILVTILTELSNTSTTSFLFITHPIFGEVFLHYIVYLVLYAGNLKCVLQDKFTRLVYISMVELFPD